MTARRERLLHIGSWLTAIPAPAEDDDSDGVPIAALIGGIIGGLAAGGVGGLLLGRRSSS